MILLEDNRKDTDETFLAVMVVLKNHEIEHYDPVLSVEYLDGAVFIETTTQTTSYKVNDILSLSKYERTWVLDEDINEKFLIDSTCENIDVWNVQK